MQNPKIFNNKQRREQLLKENPNAFARDDEAIRLLQGLSSEDKKLMNLLYGGSAKTRYVRDFINMSPEQKQKLAAEKRKQVEVSLEASRKQNLENSYKIAGGKPRMPRVPSLKFRNSQPITTPAAPAVPAAPVAPVAPQPPANQNPGYSAGGMAELPKFEALRGVLSSQSAQQNQLQQVQQQVQKTQQQLQQTQQQMQEPQETEEERNKRLGIYSL